MQNSHTLLLFQANCFAHLKLQSNTVVEKLYIYAPEHWSGSCRTCRTGCYDPGSASHTLCSLGFKNICVQIFIYNRKLYVACYDALYNLLFDIQWDN